VALSTGGDERDPWISGDGLTLYFASNQRGTSDIFQSTRGTTAMPFVTANFLVNLSRTDDNEDRPSLTADGTTLALARDTGPSQRTQVYLITRSPTEAEFGSPNQDHLGNVNVSHADQFDPFLSADGKALYLARDPSSPTRRQIMVATRGDATSDFETPQPVENINASGADNAQPALSLDERVIVFSSDRGGGTDLWYATRPDTRHDFGTPVAVPTVNGGQIDGDPMLSSDGCELYFSSARNGSFDLFVAKIAP